MTTEGIVSALAKAQGSFKPIVKKQEGQARGGKYKYADLFEVLNSVIPALSANSLAITQTLRPEGEWMALVTSLRHTSGEVIESIVPITVDGNPQVFGSLITYLRRYSLQALLGVAAEDDDGEAAVDQPAPQQPQKGKRQRQAPPVEDLPTGDITPRGPSRPDIIGADGSVVASCASYGQVVEFLEGLALDVRVDLSARNRELLRRVADSERAPADLRKRAQLLWNLAIDADLEHAA